MKYFLGVVLSLLIFTSVSFSQQITDYHYNPGDAIHPLKLTSMIMRPPVALLNIVIEKGFYGLLGSKAADKALNIEYPSHSFGIDSDY